jgi:aspartyl-tRNA synthetase
MELDERRVGDLIVRHGGAVAHGLLGSHYHWFCLADVDGVVGYRRSWGCAVALGDPVCSTSDVPRLAARFRDYCIESRRDTIYADGSERFATTVCEWGAAAAQFGETLIFDPRRDPQCGSRGRELRKKVFRARRENVVVCEYEPDRVGRDQALEDALGQVALDWLAARHGLQIFVSPVRLFDPCRAGRRWFYARVGARVVGVLALVRMDARAGYLIQHLLAAPGSPVGVTEMLVAACFAVLGAEQCRFATFGPAPAAELGAVWNLGRRSEALARRVYATASRRFHLDRRARFQRKFQVENTEAAFLVFDPPRVRLRDVIGMLRTFNVSLR